MINHTFHNMTKPKKTSNFFGRHDGQCYGITTLGERGQVVIPNELRRELKLETGDKLLVFSRFGKITALIKASEMENFLGTIFKHFGQAAIPKRYQKKFDSPKLSKVKNSLINKQEK